MMYSELVKDLRYCSSGVEPCESCERIGTIACEQYYFIQDNGWVYSRDSCQYMTVEQAYTEFSNRIGDDGSI